jgi:hypothetical protein
VVWGARGALKGYPDSQFEIVLSSIDVEVWIALGYNQRQAVGIPPPACVGCLPNQEGYPAKRGNQEAEVCPPVSHEPLESCLGYLPFLQMKYPK